MSTIPLLFFGDDTYSLTVLKLLHQSPHLTITAIVTRPPKPVGRHHRLTPSPPADFANQHRLPIIHYHARQLSLTLSQLSQLPSLPPLAVLASFGHILPPEIIDLFPQGIINIHPSLLPQYRGATPVQHALALGDKQTGVTLFPLTPQIDKGHPLAQLTEPILPTDTTPTLSQRLFTKGTQLLIDYLLHPPSSPISLQSPSTPLIFTRRFTRQTGFIPWQNLFTLITNQPLLPSSLANPLLKLRFRLQSPSTIPSSWLYDLTRALHPWPSVWTIAPTLKDQLRLKLLPPPSSTSPYLVHLAGKPRPLPWPEFQKYYLQKHSK